VSTVQPQIPASALIAPSGVLEELHKPSTYRPELIHWKTTESNVFSKEKY
jgi:hypothetical protein